MVEKLLRDLHPPLSRHESRVESDRCYFCHDAPCMQACPTGIDIPMFIRQISTGNPKGAAKTIFDENIMGGMCARDCPTETLCEEACVRNIAEDQPVKIGELQRFATDALMATGEQPYQRQASTGKEIAVVGAGPAGLACAHRLAMHGHAVTLFDANEKPGGLNEYGIAAYKTVDNFAQREVAYVLSIGGITLATGKALGKDFDLAGLASEYDAVFLGLGLDSVNALGLDGEDLDGVEDAVSFIADLRQSEDPASIPMQKDVVVIGGGMTAIDAAMQSRLLGGSNVTVAYRRGIENMNASAFEQELAQTHGISIKPWLSPKKLHQNDGKVTAVEFEITELRGDSLKGTGEMVTIPADRVFKAIGQQFDDGPLAGCDLKASHGRISVDDNGRTSHPKIWAGGDCVAGGEDLTVAAVQDGKLAAESIHRSVMR